MNLENMKADFCIFITYYKGLNMDQGFCHISCLDKRGLARITLTRLLQKKKLGVHFKFTCFI